MEDFGSRPLVLLTLGLIAGIVLAAGHPAVAFVAVAGATGAALLGKRARRLRAAALVVGGAAAGFALYTARASAGTGVSRLPPGGQTLVGTVAGAPRYRDGVWAFVLDVEQHDEGRQSEATSGRVYVVLRASEPVARGERWRLTGRLRPLKGQRNPGGASEAARLGSLDVAAVLTVGAGELAERIGPGRLDPVARHAFGAQRRALALLERFVAGPYRELVAAVAASVIFGVHAAPPPAEISDAFRRAGTIHLLVVSGAMVSMVFGMVFLPGAIGAGWRRLQLERQADWPVTGRGRITMRPGLGAAAVGMIAVTYYATLTEGGQAVTRAAIMGVLLGLAFALRRIPPVAREHGLNVDKWTLLAAAALGILAVRPGALFQPGFQLSFAAVAAILWAAPTIASRSSGVAKWAAWSAAGTLAAQLATFPILAWQYGQAPIAGFGANLLAIPLASVVLAGGMATCLLGAVAPWCAPAAGWVTGLSTRALVRVSAAFAALPGASPAVGRPSPLAVAGWYAALAAAAWWLGRRAERRGSR